MFFLKHCLLYLYYKYIILGIYIYTVYTNLSYISWKYPKRISPLLKNIHTTLYKKRNKQTGSNWAPPTGSIQPSHVLHGHVPVLQPAPLGDDALLRGFACHTRDAPEQNYQRNWEKLTVYDRFTRKEIPITLKLRKHSKYNQWINDHVINTW